jgi:hypothetical protein
VTFHRCDGGRGRVTLEKEKPPVMEKIQRNAVPTSSDPFEFQHRMDFPRPFRPPDAAHNHSADHRPAPAIRRKIEPGIRRMPTDEKKFRPFIHDPTDR